MTKTEFCKYCGIGYSTFKKIMKQPAKGRISRAILVAIAIGVEVDELLLVWIFFCGRDNLENKKKW